LRPVLESHQMSWRQSEFQDSEAMLAKKLVDRATAFSVEL
jgi:hypothetical protein